MKRYWIIVVLLCLIGSLRAQDFYRTKRWEIAIIHLVCGLLFCVTIVGIPLGLQHFKMAVGSIFPFGKEIR